MAVPCCRSVSGSAVGHRQHSLSEYSHPPLTRRERGKKNLSISPCVWVVAPSAREAPICLSLSFPFPTGIWKKKIRNLLSLSSLLLTNQPVCRKFETTVKYLKSSEAQGGTLRWVTIECVWKEEVWPSQPQPPSHYHLKFGFLGQFLFTPIEQACCFLIYWWEDC